MRENHSLALKFAPSSIKIVGLGSDDFMNGKQRAHMILGLLWQIVRVIIKKKPTKRNKNFQLILFFFFKINKTDLMTRVSKFSETADEDEAPEEILLRWFNEILDKANHSNRRVENLASDIAVFFLKTH